MPARSPTSSSAGSTRARSGRGGRSLMVEAAREVLAGEEAWIVGGAVRDRLLGREVVDVDIACREPERAARRYAKRSGGAPFPVSVRHRAWRVALADGRTIDFTPLTSTIEDDLATRDFTINAIAEPLAGGEAVDPFGGRDDIEARVVRAVSDGALEADPLRLLRAVRLEDELGFRMAPETEALVRKHAGLASQPAGERILGELRRLSAAGFRRLGELGLLAPLGGSLDGPLGSVDSPEFRLVAVFGERLRRGSVSTGRARYAPAPPRPRPADDRPPPGVPPLRRAAGP